MEKDFARIRDILVKMRKEIEDHCPKYVVTLCAAYNTVTGDTLYRNAFLCNLLYTEANRHPAFIRPTRLEHIVHQLWVDLYNYKARLDILNNVIQAIDNVLNEQNIRSQRSA